MNNNIVVTYVYLYIIMLTNLYNIIRKFTMESLEFKRKKI